MWANFQKDTFFTPRPIFQSARSQLITRFLVSRRTCEARRGRHIVESSGPPARAESLPDRRHTRRFNLKSRRTWLSVPALGESGARFVSRVVDATALSFGMPLKRGRDCLAAVMGFPSPSLLKT